ncbi:MAG TPA: PAS domain S-box protein [Acidimicrobiales bacterium]|nr:PAS domain S-box protein [Acidimicrobiales bacterium]
MPFAPEHRAPRRPRRQSEDPKLSPRGPVPVAPARPERTEASLHHVLDAAADAYLAMDTEGFVVDWSPQAERLFGFSESEIIGRQLSFFPTTPEGDEGDPVQLASQASFARSRRMVSPLKRRDGRFVPVEFTIWPTSEEGRVTHHILAREMATGASRTAELFCQVGSIVTCSDAAIFSEDPDGRILTWNKSAERIYGYAAKEALGKPSSLIVPPEKMAEMRRCCEEARRGEAVASHETIRLRKDGSLVDVAITISPIYDAAGGLAGISTIARDITEQRRVAAALEEALEEARRAEARSRRFLADAAHQLRNPIAGVRACADSLLRTTITDTHEELLALLMSESFRASRLVSSLLRIASLDRGESPTLRQGDVVAICRDEVERVRVRGPQLDVSVRVAVPLEHEPFLDADSVREILGNLLDNARRHARSRIEVVVSPLSHEGVEVRVIDDGLGLAPGTEEVVFERFASLDGAGGSGLGLPIARGLAQSHGGDLTYEDGVFVLRLPGGTTS